MKFIIVLAIAIGILYWLKQKGIRKDREIEQERIQRENAIRKAKEKQKEKETIRELREEIDRLNERLDEQDDYL